MENYDQLLNQKDKVILAEQVDLGAVEECLLSGTAGNIIEERMGQEAMKQRLRVMIEKGGFSPPEEDPWKEEWHEILGQIGNEEQ